MLDAQELAERLRAAMDLREPPLLSSELARRMGVTKQAVYEWRTHGRIAKRHFEGICRETDMPLEYFLESARGSTPATKVIWRRLGKFFTKVAMLALLALPLPRPAEAMLHNVNYDPVIRIRSLLSLLFGWLLPAFNTPLRPLRNVMIS